MRSLRKVISTELRKDKCGFCGNSMNGINYIGPLEDSFKVQSADPGLISVVTRSCFNCFEKRRCVKCIVTGKLISNSENRSSDFEERWGPLLRPYHSLGDFDWAVSEEGSHALMVEVRKVDELRKAFVGHSKSDFVRGYDVIERIRWIETPLTLKSVEEVEQIIQLYTAQVGGNAFIEFHWDRHVTRHDERYQAGVGPNGNPYYRTRTEGEVTFSGKAVAVKVRYRQKSHPSVNR